MPRCKGKKQRRKKGKAKTVPKVASSFSESKEDNAHKKVPSYLKALQELANITKIFRYGVAIISSLDEREKNGRIDNFADNILKSCRDGLQNVKKHIKDYNDENANVWIHVLMNMLKLLHTCFYFDFFRSESNKMRAYAATSSILALLRKMNVDETRVEKYKQKMIKHSLALFGSQSGGVEKSDEERVCEMLSSGGNPVIDADVRSDLAYDIVACIFAKQGSVPSHAKAHQRLYKWFQKNHNPIKYGLIPFDESVDEHYFTNPDNLAELKRIYALKGGQVTKRQMLSARKKYHLFRLMYRKPYELDIEMDYSDASSYLDVDMTRCSWPTFLLLIGHFDIQKRLEEQRCIKKLLGYCEQLADVGVKQICDVRARIAKRVAESDGGEPEVKDEPSLNEGEASDVEADTPDAIDVVEARREKGLFAALTNEDELKKMIGHCARDHDNFDEFLAAIKEMSAEKLEPILTQAKSSRSSSPDLYVRLVIRAVGLYVVLIENVDRLYERYKAREKKRNHHFIMKVKLFSSLVNHFECAVAMLDQCRNQVDLYGGHIKKNTQAVFDFVFETVRLMANEQVNALTRAQNENEATLNYLRQQPFWKKQRAKGERKKTSDAAQAREHLDDLLENIVRLKKLSEKRIPVFNEEEVAVGPSFEPSTEALAQAQARVSSASISVEAEHKGDEREAPAVYEKEELFYKVVAPGYLGGTRYMHTVLMMNTLIVQNKDHHVYMMGSLLRTPKAKDTDFCVQSPKPRSCVEEIIDDLKENMAVLGVKLKEEGRAYDDGENKTWQCAYSLLDEKTGRPVGNPIDINIYYDNAQSQHEFVKNFLQKSPLATQILDLTSEQGFAIGNPNKVEFSGELLQAIQADPNALNDNAAALFIKQIVVNRDVRACDKSHLALLKRWLQHSDHAMLTLYRVATRYITPMNVRAFHACFLGPMFSNSHPMLRYFKQMKLTVPKRISVLLDGFKLDGQVYLALVLKAIFKTSIHDNMTKMGLSQMASFLSSAGAKPVFIDAALGKVPTRAGYYARLYAAVQNKRVPRAVMPRLSVAATSAPVSGSGSAQASAGCRAVSTPT